MQQCLFMNRKKYITTCFILTVALLGCNSGKKQENTDTDTAASIRHKRHIIDIARDEHYLWEVAIDDSTGAVRLARAAPVSPDSLTASFIINRLNNRYQGIFMKMVRIAGDTIFVAIPQSSILTRQSGSTGAENYMAEATYNLTELKNINYVNFNFKKGDHAEPGTFSKTDFSELLK